METEKIHIVVCPKQKLVKILSRRGKKGKADVLKVYRFKEKIPMVQKTIQVEHYDWGEWCVSERSSITEKVINVYDDNAINSIKQRALEYYLANI